MARKDFHHPFPPYDIQQQFMESVYNCIEQRKVGVFESPTGTGKSLSLICGSLTWLREFKRKTYDKSLVSLEAEDDEPEWLRQYASNLRRKETRQLRDDFEARLTAVREKERGVRRKANGEPAAKRRKGEASHDTSVWATAGGDDEDQFLLDDYEDKDAASAIQPSTSFEYSTETKQLMEKLGFLQKDSRGGEEESPDELKIYFCSRTHSQLSQFVGELARVKLPAVLPPADPDSVKSGIELVEELKHLTLGSRRNLCINRHVVQLKNPTAINERCLELQQANVSTDKKCAYLPSKDQEDLILNFRDKALAEIQDIEDLADVGRNVGVCPYYASRSAIAPAEIVSLPYPLLLQKTAREALGISLKDHVVIIDEAHNLMDAIEGIYSCQISEVQLRLARESLIAYLLKFRNRLKGSNRVYVTQVVRVLDSLLHCVEALKVRQDLSGTIQPGDLLAGKSVDQINLVKLMQYIQQSKLARKVEGYVAHAKQSQAHTTKEPNDGETTDVPMLMHVQSFLLTLMNPAREGRFFWAKESGQMMLRYMLLDPNQAFQDIVDDARAVILAGGTMSPMDDYKQQLFPYLDHVETLSCGHIIPPSHLLVRTIPSDKYGALDFKYKSRSSQSTIDRLGQVLLQVLPTVRGGAVVFFASYKYLDEILQSWRQDNTLNTLRSIKPLFTDERSGAADNIFKTYSEAVRANPSKGAVLFSVIGGKLSEGINFSDDLGRCVIVVGRPYPNVETPEWKAKMQYLDDRAVANGQPRGQAGREHAENVCMRAVNQAIGRVVRHKNDWASILLVGAPYALPKVQAKLPGWIKENLPTDGEQGGDNVARVRGDLQRFFESKA